MTTACQDQYLLQPECLVLGQIYQRPESVIAVLFCMFFVALFERYIIGCYM